jgi:thiamine biosynthesis lipoprotein
MRYGKTLTDARHTLFALSALLILALLLLLSSCAAGAETAGGEPSGGESLSYYDNVDFAMGTVVTQTIYSDDRSVAPEVISLLTETEEKRISWREEGSEVAEINRGAGSGAPTEVSGKTIEYIRSVLDVAADSGGAFDPTIGKLSRLWDFDGGGNVVPGRAEIAALAEDVGYTAISLDGNAVTLGRGVSIDLGAIGKGIGCDEIERYLSGRSDVRGALVNIGGSSVLTYGEKDTREPWKVAVLDPRDESGFLGALSLEGANHVSSSGDYERFFEAGGVRYHHILDPSTGYPADSGLISVTVVMDSGAYCDALSTACFVLGYERAQALLAKYGAEAIFVDSDKNVRVTDGLNDLFELMADGYTLV